MIRLACVVGVVVGLSVSAVETYRPQAQPVVQRSRQHSLTVPSGGVVQIPDIPSFRRSLPGTEGDEIQCHTCALSLPVVCRAGRWYMANGDDTSAAK